MQLNLNEMSINTKLESVGVVILSDQAGNFTPSEFNQYSLDVNRIILANELDKSSTFTPYLVQAKSKKLNLVVTQDQLQFTPTSIEFHKEQITNNFIAMLNLISEVGMNGFGLNFHMLINDEFLSHAELSKKLFRNPTCKIDKYFDSEDSMFGCYMSRNIDDLIRLKLDIKPTIFVGSSDPAWQKAIQCIFNFHSDLKGDNQKEMIKKIISNYDVYFSLTQEIINTLTK